MDRKTGLGRGLKALISDQNDMVTSDGVSEISLNDIEANPNQPRKKFSEEPLVELAESIKANGVLQPIILKRTESGYEIIAGERRFRAAKIAGLDSIPAIVKHFSVEDSYKISLIENLQRENLNPMEEAISYKKLRDDFHFSQEMIAAAVGKNRSTVTNQLRLLNLDKRVQDLIFENKLSNGHGRALLAITDLNAQFELAEHVIEEELSVRETERLVQKFNEKDAEKKKPVMPDNKAFSKISNDLMQIFGTKVSIKKKAKGGAIIVDFYSDDDLERIFHIVKR